MLHIATDQEIGRFEDAGQVSAGSVFHLRVDLGTDADEDRLEAFLEETVNRFIFTDVGVRDELASSAFELFPFFLPDILGEFEVGNALDEQSARRRLGFENRHFVSALNELVGATQTSGSRADDGNLLSSGRTH